MKKSDYWHIVRQQRAYTGVTPHDDPLRLARPRELGLALYAHDFWRQNGVLPEDYMPIPGKEEDCDVLRKMWEIVERDPSFQTVVLDAYEKNYFTVPNSEDYEWEHICRNGVGPFRSAVEAPQLRRILREALRRARGLQDGGSEKITGLMRLCLEHCQLKWRAGKFGGREQALFNNSDVLSIISEYDGGAAREVEAVLEAFEKTRKELDPCLKSRAEDDQKSFDQDVRPVLIGKLIKGAKTFAAWYKVLTLAGDQGTKVFALYHMHDKAKSLNQMVELYQSAIKVDLASVAQAAKETWEDMCSQMGPEDIMKMSPDLRLDHKFLEDLILQKCES